MLGRRTLLAMGLGLAVGLTGLVASAASWQIGWTKVLDTPRVGYPAVVETRVKASQSTEAVVVLRADGEVVAEQPTRVSAWREMIITLEWTPEQAGQAALLVQVVEGGEVRAERGLTVPVAGVSAGSVPPATPTASPVPPTATLAPPVTFTATYAPTRTATPRPTATATVAVVTGPSIEIEGDAAYIKAVHAGLEMMRQRSPADYLLVTGIVTGIRSGPQNYSWSGNPVIQIAPGSAKHSPEYAGSIIIHEATHVHRSIHGPWPAYGCVGEAAALEAQALYLDRVGERELARWARGLMGSYC